MSGAGEVEPAKRGPGARTSTAPATAPTPYSSAWYSGVRFGVALALAAGGAYLILRLLESSKGPLTWVTIGLLIAIALSPVVDKIAHRLHVPRGVAVAIVLLLASSAIIALVVFLSPRAVEQAQEFKDELPQIVDGLRDLPFVGRFIQPDTADRLTEWLQDLPGRLGTDDGALARGFQTVADGLVVAGEILLVLIVTLIDGGRLARWARGQLPEQHQDGAAAAGAVAGDVIGRYFAGSLLIAVMNGLWLLVIGLALGIPLAPFVAVWAMVTNLIPQIGGFLGGFVFVILGLTQGVGTGVICLAWFVIYQQVENHFLQPTIVGEAVDISPVGTMMAALIGASALGVPGAMVAIPLIGTVKAIYVARHPERTRRSTSGGGKGRQLLERIRRRKKAPPGEAPATAGETSS